MGRWRATRALLARHYSAPLLASAQARDHFVAPDLAPLPACAACSPSASWRQWGVSRTTILYYEQAGLTAPVSRSDAG